MFTTPLLSDVVVIASGACTARVVVPATPLNVAVIVLLPAFTAVAKAALVMVATLVLDEVHVA